MATSITHRPQGLPAHLPSQSEGLIADEVRSDIQGALTADIAPMPYPELWILMGLAREAEDQRLHPPIPSSASPFSAQALDIRTNSFLRRGRNGILHELEAQLASSSCTPEQIGFMHAALQRVAAAHHLVEQVQHVTQEIAGKVLACQEG